MQAGGHEFDSRILHLAVGTAENLIRYSSLAQSVEHSAVNRSVVGSSPTGGAKPFSGSALFSSVSGLFFFRFIKMGQIRGKLYNFQPLKLLVFFFLQLLCHMQIDLPGDLAVRVAKAPGYRVNVDSLLHQQAGMRMPLRYNKDKRKNPVFSRVSAFVVAYSIPFPTLIVNEKSVE